MSLWELRLTQNLEGERDWCLQGKEAPSTCLGGCSENGNVLVMDCGLVGDSEAHTAADLGLHTRRFQAFSLGNPAGAHRENWGSSPSSAAVGRAGLL